LERFALPHHLGLCAASTPCPTLTPARPLSPVSLSGQVSALHVLPGGGAVSFSSGSEGSAHHGGRTVTHSRQAFRVVSSTAHAHTAVVAAGYGDDDVDTLDLGRELTDGELVAATAVQHATAVSSEGAGAGHDSGSKERGALRAAAPVARSPA
jgi:hypothetical protein